MIGLLPLAPVLVVQPHRAIPVLLVAAHRRVQLRLVGLAHWVLRLVGGGWQPLVGLLLPLRLGVYVLEQRW
jgi:hypothetical protein